MVNYIYMVDIDHQIREILERNKRVEQDKAWETSSTRRGFIAIITYLVGCILLWWLGRSLFWLEALVPAGAYVISTLSLPWVKQWWLRRK